MDWFQWLSQTTLHPSLVYNYGVLFACNDLTLNDVAYFDHDFLLSMGVKIGKHRLEILKLARAQTHHKNHSFMSFVATARRLLVQCAKKLSGGGGGGCKEEAEGLSFRRISSPLQVEWKEIREEGVEEKGIVRSGNVGFDGSRFLRSPGLMVETGGKTSAKSGLVRKRKMMGPRRYMSGPINGGRPVKAQIARFSGPLDEKLSPRYSGPLDEISGFNKSPIYSSEPLDEKLMGMNKSPRLSGQLDECHSPWAMLFDDLKPT